MYGINDQQTQKKLPAEKALSFDRAIEIALAVESATKGARDITSRTCDNTPLHVASFRQDTPSSCCFRHDTPSG